MFNNFKFYLLIIIIIRRINRIGVNLRPCFPARGPSVFLRSSSDEKKKNTFSSQNWAINGDNVCGDDDGGGGDEDDDEDDARHRGSDIANFERELAWYSVLRLF